eukprot:29876-Pelagococcus_subviridis.AAC.2
MFLRQRREQRHRGQPRPVDRQLERTQDVFEILSRHGQELALPVGDVRGDDRVRGPRGAEVHERDLAEAIPRTEPADFVPLDLYRDHAGLDEEELIPEVAFLEDDLPGGDRLGVGHSHDRSTRRLVHASKQPDFRYEIEPALENLRFRSEDDRLVVTPAKFKRAAPWRLRSNRRRPRRVEQQRDLAKIRPGL